MGLDPEVLQQLIFTFQSELSEQTQVITHELLLLEKGFTDEIQKNNSLTTVFRAAHNIKGAARGIGVQTVGEIAHRIETIFTLIQKKFLRINDKLIDLCLEAVDKMQLAMQSFIQHEDLSFDLNDLLNRLDKMGQSSSVPIENNKLEKQLKDDPATIIDKKIEHSVTHEEINKDKKGNVYESDHYELIRVPLKKIDKISSLMEEVQVNKLSIEDYYLEMSRITKRIRDFSDIFKKNRSYLLNYNEEEIKHHELMLYRSVQDFFIDISYIINQLEKSMQLQLNDLSMLTSSLHEEIRMLRLVPVSNLLDTLPRYVRSLSKELNKDVEIQIEGGDVRMDKLILENLKDPVIHILRNAIDHGIEEPEIREKKGKTKQGHIHLTVKDESNQIVFSIQDDGMGIDAKKIAIHAEKNKLATHAELNDMPENQVLDFIFYSGFSTKDIITDVSGRGVGLDVVKNNINNIKGTVNVVTKLGEGTTFNLRLPLTLSSERGLLVRSDEQYFVFTTSSVERVITLSSEDLIEVEGDHAVFIKNQPVPFRVLARALHINKMDRISQGKLAIVILKNNKHRVAFLVDEIIGEREIVIKSLKEPLSVVKCIMGGTLLERNQVALVIDSNDLINTALQGTAIHHVELQNTVEKMNEVPHILVVDDSITTRTLERNILEGKDYQVTIAVNGKEAWDLLQKHRFSLMITDVSMPIMDGLTLTEKVKKSEKFRDLPVIIVTSLGSNEEKARGIEVGADAYIVKSEFESGALLEIVNQLV